MVFARTIPLVLLAIAFVSPPEICQGQWGGCRQVSYEYSLPTPTFHTQILRPDLMNSVRRIAILDFENGTRVHGLDRRVRTLFAGALRSGGKYDVADVGAAFPQPCQVEAVLRSQYPIQILADCWRYYRAEAVLFARIDEFQSFSPLGIGFTAHIVDSQDAVLIATVNDYWSLDDPEIARAYRDWLRKRHRKCKDLQIYLKSPREFTAFVMDRISQELK
ncbi:MAG: hypothetical protein GY819_04200 [Planctomycetaceae bacterium]|nr:hypothetical protein [Planctomycetaceae bacterium]